MTNIPGNYESQSLGDVEELTPSQVESPEETGENKVTDVAQQKIREASEESDHELKQLPSGKRSSSGDVVVKPGDTGLALGIPRAFDFNKKGLKGAIKHLNENPDTHLVVKEGKIFVQTKSEDDVGAAKQLIDQLGKNDKLLSQLFDTPWGKKALSKEGVREARKVQWDENDESVNQAVNRIVEIIDNNKDPEVRALKLHQYIEERSLFDTNIRVVTKVLGNAIKQNKKAIPLLFLFSANSGKKYSNYEDSIKNIEKIAKKNNLSIDEVKSDILTFLKAIENASVQSKKLNFSPENKFEERDVKFSYLISRLEEKDGKYDEVIKEKIDNLNNQLDQLSAHQEMIGVTKQLREAHPNIVPVFNAMYSMMGNQTDKLRFTEEDGKIIPEFVGRERRRSGVVGRSQASQDSMTIFFKLVNDVAETDPDVAKNLVGLMSGSDWGKAVMERPENASRAGQLKGGVKIEQPASEIEDDQEFPENVTLDDAISVLDSGKRLVYLGGQDGIPKFEVLSRGGKFRRFFGGLFGPSRESVEAMENVLELIGQEMQQDPVAASEKFAKLLKNPWARRVMSNRLGSEQKNLVLNLYQNLHIAGEESLGKAEGFRESALKMLKSWASGGKPVNANALFMYGLELSQKGDSQKVRAARFIWMAGQADAISNQNAVGRDKRKYDAKDFIGVNDDLRALFKEKSTEVSDERNVAHLDDLLNKVENLKPDQKVVRVNVNGKKTFKVVSGSYDPESRRYVNTMKYVNQSLRQLSRINPQLAMQQINQMNGTEWGGEILHDSTKFLVMTRLFEGRKKFSESEVTEFADFISNLKVSEGEKIKYQLKLCNDVPILACKIFFREGGEIPAHPKLIDRAITNLHEKELMNFDDVIPKEIQNQYLKRTSGIKKIRALFHGIGGKTSQEIKHEINLVRRSEMRKLSEEDEKYLADVEKIETWAEKVSLMSGGEEVKGGSSLEDIIGPPHMRRRFTCLSKESGAEKWICSLFFLLSQIGWIVMLLLLKKSENIV